MIKRALLLLMIPSFLFATCPDTLEVVAAGQSNINPYFFPHGEEGFEDTIAATCPSTIVHFTDCAVSGTEIALWQPGGDLMNDCFDATTLLTPNVVIFYQGESDSATLCTPNYDELLTNTLNGFSSHYGIPYISFAQISTIDDLAYNCQQSIRDQQASVETATWPMITTTDLTKRDFIHLDDDSEYIVGQRFATEILGLIAQAPTVGGMHFQSGSAAMRFTGHAGTMVFH